VRLVISLVIAIVASIAGTLLLWYGGGHTVFQVGRFGAEGGTGLYPLLTGVGCLLLAAAAASVRWSSAGVLVAGTLHVLFSALAVLVPFAPLEGMSSPAIQLLNQLVGLDEALATGAFYFVAFGGGLLIGFALLGVGILARRRRPSVLWRVLSAVGGVLAIGPAVWAFVAGGDFYRRTFQMLDWDAGAAVVLVAASLLFGVLLAPSGRSAIGAWIAGGVLSLIGVVLLVAEPIAFSDVSPALLVTLPVLGWSGTILAVGFSVLGLALGITLRPASVVADAQDPAPAAV
jgi:hypothetical protein